MSSKPTIPDVVPLVQKLYARDGGGVGCCLHIVLDDGNVDDDDVQFCIDEATDIQHADCLELARLLMQMSKTQRTKLGRVEKRRGTW